MKFILTKHKKRTAVSPVIATLLLIAIAVAAAIIVYAFVTGLIGGLTGSATSLVVVSGTLTVPTGSGPGTLVVTVTNKASNAMNAIAIANDGANTPVGFTTTYASQNGAEASGPVAPGSAAQAVLCLTTAIVEPVPATIPAPCVSGTAGAGGSSVPIGSSASAIGTVASATAGQTYSFSIYVYIGASTTPTIQSFSVSATV